MAGRDLDTARGPSPTAWLVTGDMGPAGSRKGFTMMFVLIFCASLHGGGCAENSLAFDSAKTCEAKAPSGAPAEWQR
jgi:hypothetical protein